MLVLTRRTTLALGATGLLGAAACSAEREGAPVGAPRESAGDDALVDEVAAQITAVAAVAANVTRLTAMHAATPISPVAPRASVVRRVRTSTAPTLSPGSRAAIVDDQQQHKEVADP